MYNPSKNEISESVKSCKIVTATPSTICVEVEFEQGIKYEILINFNEGAGDITAYIDNEKAEDPEFNKKGKVAKVYQGYFSLVCIMRPDILRQMVADIEEFGEKALEKSGEESVIGLCKMVVGEDGFATYTKDIIQANPDNIREEMNELLNDEKKKYQGVELTKDEILN